MNTFAAASSFYPKRETEQFTACVWTPGDIIEIRAIKKGEVVSRWYLVEHLPSKLHELAELNAAKFNIYGNCLPPPRAVQAWLCERRLNWRLMLRSAGRYGLAAISSGRWFGNARST